MMERVVAKRLKRDAIPLENFVEVVGFLASPRLLQLEEGSPASFPLDAAQELSAAT